MGQEPCIDLNTNHHQFVDSVRGNTTALTCPSLAGDQAYIAPSGDSVVVLELQFTDPSINGFDIVTYTGNAPLDYSHSLGKALSLSSPKSVAIMATIGVVIT